MEKPGLFPIQGQLQLVSHLKITELKRSEGFQTCLVVSADIEYLRARRCHPEYLFEDLEMSPWEVLPHRFATVDKVTIKYQLSGVDAAEIGQQFFGPALLAPKVDI